MAKTDSPLEGEAVLTEEEDAKLECVVDIQDAGAWQKKITVTIPRSEIDGELSKEFKDLRQSAEVPGFRKGHAPLKLVEKRFGSEVADQAKFRLLAKAFEQIDDAQDFEVLGEPNVDLEKVILPDDGDMTFEYEVEVKPEFELPELEGIRIEKPLFQVTKEKVDEALKNILDRYGRSVDVSEEGAKAEDMVRCDVTLKVDGVDEPEVLENYTLHVVEEGGAGGVMIEKLDKLLTGVKTGDTKTTKSKAPESHANEAYQNKDVDITVTVKNVQRHIPAALDEVFLSRLGVGDDAELRQLIETDLENQADTEVRRAMASQVSAYLADKVVFELPTGVASRHSSRALQRRYYELLNMGIPQEKIDENIEKLRASAADEAATELKMSFITEAVAEKLDVTVGDAEVNSWIAQIAMRQRRRPEKIRDELRKEGRLADLELQIRQEKAIDKILETADVVDAPL